MCTRRSVQDRSVRASGGRVVRGLAACGCVPLLGCSFIFGPGGGSDNQNDNIAARACGGFLGVGCEPGELCKHEDGDCDTAEAVGVCMELPDICTEEYAPVCGCDGETYSNDCFAEAAGVNVDYRGECAAPAPRECGGLLGVQCEESELCKLAIGSCDAADVAGQCISIPDDCADIFDPVCGCDGVTYVNECGAEAAGVNVDYEGECEAVEPTACGGALDVDCGEGSFCKLPTGSCDAQDVMGECTVEPDGCSDVFEPVCGCDGVTYGNACEADAAGVNVDHEGECADERTVYCGGEDGFQCPDGQFCKLLAGTCDDETALGVCLEIPTETADVNEPVCGCDGTTYVNAWEAASFGVSIRHVGDCDSPPPTCGGFAGEGCAATDDSCVLPSGCEGADLTGVCEPLEPLCRTTAPAVCGCDGVTYDTECAARTAGVQIERIGPCEDAPGTPGE